ncbi:LarC family nickel insertion protein [Brachybacterium sp. ACRRE]|nr:LarC family nickel insertion protein [Brachybacterium sp. ACRRE]
MRALAQTAGPQPALTVEAVGIGAGTKDTPGRPNVVRVMVGRDADTPAGPDGGPDGAASGHAADAFAADAHATPRSAVQLEANVDDLDPRLWPGVITSLLESGALDAWLTPIIMKQGRPGITVHALVREGDEVSASSLIMDLTGSLGVRRFAVDRSIRTRAFEQVEVDGQQVRVKVARDSTGRMVRREPEFRDVQAAARELGISEREALEQTRAAARRES